MNPPQYNYLKTGFVVIITAISLKAFPAVPRTLLSLNRVAGNFASMSNRESVVGNLGRPLAGMSVLPFPVMGIIELFKEYHVTSFRYSSGIGRINMIRQRLVEGSYPVRVSSTAHYLVYIEGEPVAPGGKVIGGCGGMLLAYYP